MRARWYDPQTGAFITRDPIGHGSGETNLYRYASGDPTNLTDPTGLLSLADVSNFASGFYDELTLGGTRKIREFIGSDGVDYCSDAYNAGGYGGMAAGMVGPGGIVRGAGRAATKVGAGAARSSFVTTPRGTTFDIPKGWVGREADNGKGIVYQRRGAPGNVDSIRIMEPTAKYPNGYFRYYNERGQPLTAAGKPGPRGDTHHHENYEGPLGGWPR